MTSNLQGIFCFQELQQLPKLGGNPTYKYVVESFRITHRKQKSGRGNMVMESQNHLPGGTRCPHVWWCFTPCRTACTAERPEVTSFRGWLPPLTNDSGHRNAWPLWTNVGQALWWIRSASKCKGGEIFLFPPPILGSLAGAQQIRWTEDRLTRGKQTLV